MTRSARLLLIAAAVTKASAVYMPTKQDAVESVALNVSRDDVRADMADDDLPALPSRLKFEQAGGEASDYSPAKVHAALSAEGVKYRGIFFRPSPEMAEPLDMREIEAGAAEWAAENPETEVTEDEVEGHKEV